MTSRLSTSPRDCIMNPENNSSDHKYCSFQVQTRVRSLVDGSIDDVTKKLKMWNLFSSSMSTGENGDRYFWHLSSVRRQWWHVPSLLTSTSRDVANVWRRLPWISERIMSRAICDSNVCAERQVRRWSTVYFRQFSGCCNSQDENRLFVLKANKLHCCLTFEERK